MATLANLVTRARFKADMELKTGQSEADHFITDAVAKQFVNDAAREVYRMLANANPDEYTEPGDSFQASVNTYEYNLPADFWKLRGVEKLEDAANDRWSTIRQANWSERNKGGLRYRRRGTKLRFIGDPSNDTYRVWYIPKLTAMALDADTYDGSEESEDLVVVKAAKLMKLKEESPIDELLLEEQRLEADLMASNVTENLEEPDTIADVYSDFCDEWPGRTARGLD